MIRLRPDRALVSLLLLGLYLTSSASAEETPVSDSAESDLAVLAQKANNPLSDVWLLVTQNDTTWMRGDLVDGTRVLNVTKVQPVMPVPLFGGEWNLIFRPVLQITSVPLDDDVGKLFGLSNSEIIDNPEAIEILQDPWGRTTGLGDSVLLTLLGPNREDGWIYGGGFTQIFPTATDDVLGQEKWQIGPAAIAVRLGKEHGGLGIENWNIGVLAQQWWSYAGDSDRRDTAQMDIQYFVNWKLNETQLIGMTPNIRINWKQDLDDAVSFPIGIGTIGMVRLGPLPVRWGIEFQYYAVRPDDFGPKYNLKVFLAPVIPNPLK